MRILRPAKSAEKMEARRRETLTPDGDGAQLGGREGAKGARQVSYGRSGHGSDVDLCTRRERQRGSMRQQMGEEREGG